MKRSSALYLASFALLSLLTYQRFIHKPITPTLPKQHTNGDEQRYADKRASFGKGLKQHKNGLMDVSAFDQLLRTLHTRKLADFNRIPWGTQPPQRIYTSLLSALPNQLFGKEIWLQSMPPAPTLVSARKAGEMVELYWHALLRDVNFTDYATHQGVAQAAKDLSRCSDFRGPKQDNAVTPHTLFRAPFKGALVGPLVSQFFYQPVPMAGQKSFEQRYIVQSATLANEFMTAFDEWFFIQQGHEPLKKITYDPTPRYMRTMRDLGNYVHQDPPQWHFMCTQLILLGFGPKALKQGAPDLTASLQPAQGEFCKLHVAALVSLATEMALRAARYQKWFVHRTLRPETCAFLIDQQITGKLDSQLHDEILNSAAVKEIFNFNTKINNGAGSYLLPQMYPEGSPMHPTYPSGHATVAGACITILKAFFNEDFVLPDPMVPNHDGTQLIPYTGEPLAIGHELNKFATNIAIARDMAGVHYRSDAIDSMRLGEKVALALLADWAGTQPTSFTLTTFDGKKVVIGETAT